MKRLLNILLLWGFWGFALGAFLLLGPLRKVLDYARSHGWSENEENMAVYGAILVLVLVTFLLAWFSVRYYYRSIYSPTNKYLLWILPVMGAGIALYLFMKPNLINADSSQETSVSSQFTIGPYPEPGKLKELKRQGYTAVISLLHPAVVPFEPKLLGEEAEHAKDAGLELISIPFLPWVSNNEASIDSLRKLVRAAKGKYYVHCYLGKDRVNVARRIIAQETGSSIQSEGIALRSMDDIHQFERGAIQKLEKDVYLAPMPTKEEYMGYIVAAGFGSVIALLDESDPGTAALVKEEKAWLEPYKIPYLLFNVNESSPEALFRKIADTAHKLPRPLLIHTFRSEDKSTQRFLDAYNKK